jgi:hypothetical protein
LTILVLKLVILIVRVQPNSGPPVRQIEGMTVIYLFVI